MINPVENNWRLPLQGEYWVAMNEEALNNLADLTETIMTEPDGPVWSSMYHYMENRLSRKNCKELVNMLFTLTGRRADGAPKKVLVAAILSSFYSERGETWREKLL